ncbi:unnamed protein product, partial [marine sediment metagenome]
MASTVCLADTDASQFDEGRTTPATVRRSYTIHNTDVTPTRAAAEQDLITDPLCPAVDFNYGSLFRDTIAVTQVPDGILDQFEAQVTWKRWKPEVLDEEFLTGNVSRVTQNKQYAFNRISSTTYPTGTPKDLNDLIGVSDSGVTGVDVPVPKMAFTIRRIYADGTFTLTLLQQLYEFVGRPNSLAWRG